MTVLAEDRDILEWPAERQVRLIDAALPWCQITVWWAGYFSTFMQIGGLTNVSETTSRQQRKKKTAVTYPGFSGLYMLLSVRLLTRSWMILHQLTLHVA